jgi:hypothetical protein
MTDARSPLAVKLIGENAHAYEALVVEGGTPPETRKLLEGVKPEQLLSVPVKSPDNASAMLAGVWLWHDGLDECHRIVQKSGESNTTFSFWHAIMHRREGDFGNSKYWYARAAGHPVLTTLGIHASGAMHSLPADRDLLKIILSGFNPAAFVDLVEQVVDRPDDPRHRTAILLQQMEWRLLFDHCTRSA